MIRTKLLGIGTILFVLGALAIGAYMSGKVEISFVFTGGMLSLIAGIIFMVFSIISLVSSAIAPPSGLHVDDGSIFSIGLLRCMLAIIIADGVIEKSEIIETAKIYKKLTKSEIDHSLIDETAKDMLESGANIITELKTLAPSLDKNLKKMIIIASLYILAADGDMDEGELIMLDDIREGLGMSFGQCEKIKNQFLKNAVIQ